jgi:hypothetical protein
VPDGKRSGAWGSEFEDRAPSVLVGLAMRSNVLKEAAQFSESVIREMTRLCVHHGAALTHLCGSN